MYIHAFKIPKDISEEGDNQYLVQNQKNTLTRLSSSFLFSSNFSLIDNR